MCNFASFVLTKEMAFWSDKTNSHDEIIKEHGLYEGQMRASINLLKVELIPTTDLFDFDSYEFVVDQDLLPKWFDKDECEKRTRTAISKRFPKGFPSDFIGNLDLVGTQITKLPENLKVGGDLYLRGTQITKLPDNLTVGGDLYFSRTKITKLPDNLTVGGYLYLGRTQITKLPEKFKNQVIR